MPFLTSQAGCITFLARCITGAPAFRASERGCITGGGSTLCHLGKCITAVIRQKGGVLHLYYRLGGRKRGGVIHLSGGCNTPRAGGRRPREHPRIRGEDHCAGPPLRPCRLAPGGGQSRARARPSRLPERRTPRAPHAGSGRGPQLRSGKPLAISVLRVKLLLQEKKTHPKSAPPSCFLASCRDAEFAAGRVGSSGGEGGVVG